MAATMLSPDRLRELASHREARGKILSVYVDLDPSVFPTAAHRRPQITSLIDEANRLVKEDASLSHEDRVALREDVRRVDEWLTRELDADGIHGLALFASTAAGVFEVVRLEHPVDPEISIGDGAQLEQLSATARSTEYWVLLVNARLGRVLRGAPTRLRPVLEISDDVHGRHRQGGWSAARYERSIEEERLDHYRQVGRAMLRLHERHRIAALIVGAQEHEETEVVSRLPDQVRRRIIGSIRVDVPNVTPDQVLAAARPVMEEHARTHEADVIERLRAAIGRGDGLAAHGQADVLDALGQEKVEVLLLSNGQTPPGAVEKAIAQDAEVLAVRHHDDLATLGGIAALLRF